MSVKAFEEIENYKKQLLEKAGGKELTEQQARELRKIVSESMSDEGGHEDDSDIDMPEGDIEGEPSEDFDMKMRELEEKLKIHTEGDEGRQADEEDYGMSDGEEGLDEEEDSLDAKIEKELAKLGEREDMEEGGHGGMNEEDTDLDQAIDQALKDLSEMEDMEDGDEDGDMDEMEYVSEGDMDLKRMKEEADKLMDELSEDIEDDLAKAMDAEEYEEDGEDMDENMSISHFNGKGQNKKPDSFKDEFPELMRNDSELQEKYNRLAKICVEQDKRMRMVEGAAQKLALYNDNLIHIVKLMQENALRSDEKKDLVEKFFSSKLKTSEDSKALYESIDRELKSKRKTSGNAKQKIQETVKGRGQEKKKLDENVAYTDRMMQLIKYK